jgi:hypothetical protein
MPFDYYYRLSPAKRAIYRKSDAVTKLQLREAEILHPLIEEIGRGLDADDRGATQRPTRKLATALCVAFDVDPVVLRVLARRPSNATSELHGLYEREEGKKAIIRVWMRTAAHERPVRLRTFVRTVLHEMCHHFDFELLKLADSYHTQGFFRRESSLARQLLPKRAKAPPPAPEEPTEEPQLSLFSESG